MKFIDIYNEINIPNNVIKIGHSFKCIGINGSFTELNIAHDIMFPPMIEVIAIIKAGEDRYIVLSLVNWNEFEFEEIQIVEIDNRIEYAAVSPVAIKNIIKIE